MKFLNIVVAVWRLVARYPAVSAGLAQVIILIGARLGLHLTTDQLATVAGVIAGIFALLVHMGVIPVTKVGNVKAGIKPTVPPAVEVSNHVPVVTTANLNPVVNPVEGK